MRPRLRTRLFELFALLVSAVLCVAFLLRGVVERDAWLLVMGLVFISPTYAAGRVIWRDWTRVDV